MATYEIWRINPATKELIERTTRKRIDAAIYQAHCVAYEIAESFGLRDRPAAHVAINAIHHFDGTREIVALIGDHEVHLFKA